MLSATVILNQDLVISSARDNGVDITAQFRDFTFNFQGVPPSGNAHVWNDLLAQTGTWKFAFRLYTDTLFKNTSC